MLTSVTNESKLTFLDCQHRIQLKILLPLKSLNKALGTKVNRLLATVAVKNRKDRVL